MRFWHWVCFYWDRYWSGPWWEKCLGILFPIVLVVACYYEPHTVLALPLVWGFLWVMDQAGML